MESVWIKENRIGIFAIDHHFIKDDEEFVRALMQHVIIVRAESMYSRDAIEYVGYSDLFEPVRPGVSAPNYRMISKIIEQNGETGEKKYEKKYEMKAEKI